MPRVFIDSAPLIYLVEGQIEITEKVELQLVDWLDAGADLYSSVITLAELLVAPERNNNQSLANKYHALFREILSGPLLTIDEQTAETAAQFRGRWGIRLPDALQLAAAVVSGCDIFYTNDKQLSKVDCLDVVVMSSEKKP